MAFFKKRRGKQWQKKYIVIPLCIIAALLFALFSPEGEREDPVPTASVVLSVQEETGSQIEASVVSVVDGDTLWVMKQGVRTKIRLIGVDTPESVHPDKTKNSVYGTEASDYMKNRLPANTQIFLEYDAEPTDRYGRELAYVFLQSETGEMELLNLELVTLGYGKTLFIRPNIRYKERFLTAEKQAKASGAGFWKDPSAVGWE